jgi:uncharacterized protein YdiU (UPF0061 family)
MAAMTLFTSAAPAPTGLNLQPALAALGPRFFATTPPTALPDPHWVARSHSLARELGLDDEWLQSEEALQAFTGNQLLPGSHPMASVYSGHQFGNWAGQLGDGRAMLLGEWATPQGQQEIQLKGAGLTPFSRMGDGRAVLRSSIREFLCSEAMHALGIPTTRALALVGSPQKVRRETLETAAVLTRTAPSFIRFGHFEHFSHNGRHDDLKRLADHVIDRYYPECRDSVAGQPVNPYAALLQAVSERTARLLAQWQAVGFCHGVMNTDNMSILGLTLDYGPFQFMDGFNPDHVCNHTDSGGRYAYNRQPQVAYWNLFCLAQALLPLLTDTDEALAALESYKTIFPQTLNTLMAAKLGLHPDAAAPLGDGPSTAAPPNALPLVDHTLRMLATERVDYSIFWRRLSHWAASSHDPAQALEAQQALHDLFINRSQFDIWMAEYQEQTVHQNIALDANLMLKNNPKFVLRNHLGQEAIQRAQQGDMDGVTQLLTVLQTPFDEHPNHEAWAGLPPDWAAHIEISCSS